MVVGAEHHAEIRTELAQVCEVEQRPSEVGDHEQVSVADGSGQRAQDPGERHPLQEDEGPEVQAP